MSNRAQIDHIEIFGQGLAMPVVMAFGLVGNLLSIVVLRSPAIDMKVTTDHLHSVTLFSNQETQLTRPVVLKSLLYESMKYADWC